MSVICGERCGYRKQEVLKYCPLGKSRLPPRKLLTTFYSRDIVHFNRLLLSANLKGLQIVFNNHLVYGEKDKVVCPNCGATLKAHIDQKKADKYIV